MTPTGPDCWGCGREPADDHGLGPACRRQLHERRTEATTPQLNALVDRLDSVYAQLCWNCASALSVGIDGLCGPCRLDVRG